MSTINRAPTTFHAYAYQGELLCQDCGRQVIQSLRDKDVRDDGDSDTFPQGPYDDGGGEADSANFCGLGKNCANAITVADHKIGCPLFNPLTRDGVENLAQSLRAMIAAPDKRSRITGRVLRTAWSPYAGPEDTFGRLSPKYVGPLGDKLPHSLSESIKQYVRQTPEKASSVRGEIYGDADHVYLLASRGPEHRHGYHWGSAVDLLRAHADDDGEFREIQVASIHPEAAAEQPVEVLIREAISEGAWNIQLEP